MFVYAFKHLRKRYLSLHVWHLRGDTKSCKQTSFYIVWDNFFVSLFKRWNNMWIMLMSCCLLPFLLLCPHLCATSFPQVDDEDPSYSMIFASLNAQTYNIFAWLYNRSLTIFSPDYSKLHLKPNTCHLLHHLFILLVGFVCFKHPPNQPKLPSQNMLNKNPVEELHQKGTKIPTPKSTWKWTYITWFF